MKKKHWVWFLMIIIIIILISCRITMNYTLEKVDTIINTTFTEYEPDLSGYITTDEFEERMNNTETEFVDLASTTKWILSDILGYQDWL